MAFKISGLELAAETGTSVRHLVRWQVTFAHTQCIMRVRGRAVSPLLIPMLWYITVG
jgi:hypothetical protein